MARVLIVDDSKTIRIILSRWLAKAGLETAQSADGVEALKLLENDSDFDAAIIDWNMPNMDGLELVEKIRSKQNLSGMKLMMATTETEAEQIELAIGRGADEYLMKPFTEENLSTKLELMGVRSS